MARRFATTPEEKAASCTSPEELDGFIQEARIRGDEQTEQAGVRRRAEMQKERR